MESHGDAGLVFHAAPKGGAWGKTHWADLQHPVVTETNGLFCQGSDDEKANCRTILIWLGADASNPKLKKNQGGFHVTSESGTEVEVRYAGAIIVSTATLKVGPGTTCPAPHPDPTPTAAATVTWKETEQGGPDHCPEGGQSLFSADVTAVLDQEFGTLGGTWVGNESALYAFLAADFRERGYDVAMYGEELALARDSAQSEQFDLLAVGGAIRRPPGAFRSVCTPATRSATIAPKPAPTPPHAPDCPPPDFLTVKEHARPQPDHVVFDSTAMIRGRERCNALGFVNRDNCPRGLEGTEARTECDMSTVTEWSYTGQIHPRQAGETNPWAFHGKPPGRARVCVGSLCAEAEAK